MYQEWIKGRSLTSTNRAELIEKEALEKERKEGNEKFDLGKQSTAGTEQIWTLVGTTLTNTQTSLCCSHTPSPLCLDLAHRLMSCFLERHKFLKSRGFRPTHFLPCTQLSHLHAQNPAVNPLPGTACFHWKTYSHLQVQVWHLS